MKADHLLISATDLPNATASGNPATVNVLAAPVGIMNVVPLQGDTANVVVFATDVDGGPMHPMMDEFNEWFDINDNGADSVRCGPSNYLPVKRPYGGSNPSKTKRARPTTTTAPMRETKQTRARRSSHKHSSVEVENTTTPV
ncbi:hypothetical protein V6N13_051234 [Hibiscus sabdariffa]